MKMKDKKGATKEFQTLYPYNDETKKSLVEFRNQPLKTIHIDGVNWYYFVTGRAERAVLFLHGMAGAYDIWWQQIKVLKQDYKIISVTYPPLDSLQKIGTALIKILKKENIKKINLVGSSLGGYIAQFMVATYPGKIEKAVFANTFPPNDLFEKQNKKLIRILPFLPERLIRYKFRRNLMKTVIPASQYSGRVKAYLLEWSYERMSKKQLIARYRCVIGKFNPADPGHNIPLMLIESANDPLIPPELRAELKKLYTFRTIYTFQDKGHFPYLNDPETYTGVIGSFLGDAGRSVYRIKKT